MCQRVIFELSLVPNLTFTWPVPDIFKLCPTLVTSATLFYHWNVALIGATPKVERQAPCLISVKSQGLLTDQ